MKLIIDNMTSHTGWIATSGVCTISTTNWKEFATSFNTSQVKFIAEAGAVVSKTLSTPLDITGYQTISIPLVAQNSESILLPADFRLKVRFYNGEVDIDDNPIYEEFYVSANMSFHPRVFAISLTTISKIELIFITDLSIMVSQIIAYVDHVPFDIYSGIEELLLSKISGLPKFQVGKISAIQGDKSPTISGLKYVDKHAVIEFGNEIHQVMSDVSNNVVSFNDYGDGRVVKATYTEEPVYLSFIPQIEPEEYDAFIPSVSISRGFGTEIVQEDEPYSNVYDSWSTNGTIRVLEVGTSWKYTIIVEASSRISDIDEYLLKILKTAFNKQSIIWINGRKHDLICKDVQWVEYGDATEILSKMQVECIIECSEELWQQEIQPINLEVTKTVTLMPR